LNTLAIHLYSPDDAAPEKKRGWKLFGRAGAKASKPMHPEEYLP